MMTLAALATAFLERPGLAKSTLRSYQSTIIPLLKEYGRWPIEIIDRPVLVEYLNHYKSWTNLIGETPELQEIRIHDLRHTFATERVGLMGIEELRALMGHESIQTTLRYQKVTSLRAEEVAQLAFKNLQNFSE
jgi:integrase